jgi:diguanylate cyclase (GGDEF)-like protein
MAQNIDPIRAYLDRIVTQSGAVSASLYVPTPWNEAQPAILVHSGPDPAVPELGDVEGARAFTAREESGSAPGAGEAPAPRPSACDRGCLLPIPRIPSLWQRVTLARADAGGPAAQRRRQSDTQPGLTVAGWIGLRFADPDAVDAPPIQGTLPAALDTLGVSSALAAAYVYLYSLLTDPLTGLPGRAELHGLLRAELDRARALGQPHSLLFVNPHGLDAINERHGRQTGDAVIRDVVVRLQQLLRRSDPILRYGGAMFALSLSDVAVDAAVVVGEKIRRHLSEATFVDGAIGLECNVGIAVFEPHGEEGVEPLDLVRRADIAVAAARRAAGSRVYVWRPGTELQQVDNLDRLLGIFTGSTDKDYRNMGLLWSALAVISQADDTTVLAGKVVDTVFQLLKPSRVALFEATGEGLRLIAGLERDDPSASGGGPLADEALDEDERQLIDRAGAEGTAQHAEVAAAGGAAAPGRDHVRFAVPLCQGDRALGTLYIAGPCDTLKLDRSDLPFLTGLAAQVAVAFDRAGLAELQLARQEQERRQLKAELQDLRSALQQAKLVYRAPAMAELLATTRRVAGTDTTVLVTGESGTGKELLAHTLHQLSSRRQRPLVIVDCGAIPSTLIESELFGRERGAYTGAQQRAIGRLAQADGGTVFLDEIGELPLEVQAKLLRFVQEKQLQMVGSVRAQRVDVRIIAATNRDLEAEVHAGRFRQDLFYRLNVVRLRMPSLRERPEDVLYLARHFLEGFAIQYHKPVRRFSAEAESQLVAYDWPGNVRELQNRVLQAVVLAEGSEITLNDLKLPRGGARQAAPVDAGPWPLSTRRPAEPAPVSFDRAPTASGPDEADVALFEVAWQALRSALAASVATAAAQGPQMALPVGRWLAHDLVLEAYQEAGQVIARAALLTGLPETTFARRLRQAVADAAVSRRPEGWPEVRRGLAAVLRSTERPADCILDRVEHLLLQEVLRQVPHNATHASQLLGLSVPTFRRRLNSIALAS